MTDLNTGVETVQLVNALHKEGKTKITVILRHSIRHYDEKLYMEPFMGLTEEGKTQCLRAGQALPEGMMLRLFSSHIGRCIETAYLMDKGYLNGGGKTESNRLVRELSPFYVKDFEKAVELFSAQRVTEFIRNWIDGKYAQDVIMDAREVADRIFQVAISGLTETGTHHIDVLVTHDWNMYLLREFGLGLAHEACGEVGFLEGIVLFQDSGEIYLTHHRAEPRRLDQAYLGRIREFAPL